MAADDITPIFARRRRSKFHESLWGECLAEFLGTAVLVLFGCGSVAVAVVGLAGSGRTEGATTFFVGAGGWLVVTWGWFLAVVFGVYVSQGISGGHINPAVTLGFAIRRKFPWRKVVPYWIAQVAGGIAGAAVILGIYKAAINTFDAAVAADPEAGIEIVGNTGHTIPSFSIFSTFPAPYFDGSAWGPLFDQIVGTAMLMLCIVAVIDNRNRAVMANMGPFIIGLSVMAVGISFGSNAGYAINPARDLGPRIIAWLGGFGELAFPGNGPWFSAYWWVPIVGPLIGGVVGVIVYDVFIGDVLHARLMAKAKHVESEAGPGTIEDFDTK